MEQWLGQPQKDHLLKQNLAIASGWELAAEVALSHWVSARVTQNLNTEEVGCWMMPATSAKVDTLAAKIESRWFPESFNDVYLAETLNLAKARQPSLRLMNL